MKKIITSILIFVSVLSFGLNTFAINAAAYAVIEKNSQRVLLASNQNVKMPMASTTKVMTATLVIENLQLDREYDIPDGAVGIEGSSIYLKKGEKLSGEELLYGLMLASGNDAAYALAILTSGSSEKFVELMNAKAQELELKNTHFADPCGLASKNHYTTAYDLARLCAYALKNETFAKIVATQNYRIRGSEEGTLRYLHNKNRVLGEVAGGDGIKTGYTRAAGRCLCSSATRNGMQVICVTLNDHEWFDDSKTLINSAFEQYELVRFAQKNEVAGSCNIVCGKEPSCDIINESDLEYPLKKGEKAYTKTNISLSAKAPVNRGQNAGETVLYVEGKEVAKTQCVFSKDVPKKFSLFGR